MKTIEEALAAGVKILPINHSMHRRCSTHDYNAPGTYLVTLVTAGRRQIFGELVMDDTPYVRDLPLGLAIRQREIRRIHEVYPMVFVWKLCIMPDHIHMIIRVSDYLPKKCQLGKVIAGFKIGCNHAYAAITKSPGVTVFEEGFNDKILHSGEHLERWRNYINDNPRRLAIKRQHPQLFSTLYAVPVGQRQCHAYGNVLLLEVPDKMAVVVHRRTTDAEYEQLRRQWSAFAEQGGVLVGAFIAQREKDVLHEALTAGYRVIKLRHDGFAPLYKPAGIAFDACAVGTYLELSPWAYQPGPRQKISRQACLELNALAEAIASPLSPRQ